MIYHSIHGHDIVVIEKTYIDDKKNDQIHWILGKSIESIGRLIDW